MKNLLLDRKTAPVPVDFASIPLDDKAVGFHQIKAEEYSLSNGIPVYWVKMGQTDILKIEFIYKAGHLHQKKNLVASFTNHLLKEGTSSRTSEEIALTLDYFGSSLSYETEKDRAGLCLYSQSRHLDRLIPLMADILINPSFPEEEFSHLLLNKRQQFLVDLQRVGYLANRKMQEVLYGSRHPYGKTIESPDFDAITIDDIRQFFVQRYRPSECFILVAGPDYQPLIGLLDDQLGQYTREASEKEDFYQDFSPVQGREDIHITKEDAVQNAIRIANRTINPVHPDFIALKVLNTLLGGYFGSRLMKTIREEKGYTYGIGSSLLSYELTGAFVVYTEVGSAVTQAALDAILYEIRRLQDDLIDEKELSLVKNYMIGSFLRSIDGTFEVASRFKELLIHGLPAGYHRNSMEEIQQIRPARLRDIAERYLDPARMSRLIAGSFEKI